MRSVLMVPANQPSKMEKASSFGADAVVFDLEDSVPAGAQKEVARHLVRESLQRTWNVPVYVRVNSVEEAQLEDLHEIGQFRVCLPKARITTIERLAGKGFVVAAPIVEDAMALIEAPAIARAPGVEAVMVGLGDMSAFFGIPEDRDGPLLAHARAQVVIAARAAGVKVLDGGLANFRDEDAFRRVAMSARQMGFDGILCIHPLHVTVANEVFRSTAGEIEWARHVIETVEAAKAEGVGVGVIDDAIVDEAHVRQAQAILARV